MEPLLTISDLSVTFATERGRVQALDGVSLELAAGETLAIVGESGSGKSVTALSILGLLGDAGQVKGGSIEFQGEDLTRVSAARLREIRGNQIAFIFQEPMSSLNPVLTIGTQVAEPIWLHHKKSGLRLSPRLVSCWRKSPFPTPHNDWRIIPTSSQGECVSG